MVFYSEDNADNAVSILLSKLLDIQFTNSNSTIRKLIINEDNFNVYLDVVPDNKNILGMYSEYRSMLNSREKLLGRKLNINIVPIPCIEYFVLKVLVSLGAVFSFKYSWLDVVLHYTVNEHKTLYKSLPPKTLEYKGSFRSFEKQCKLLLDNSDEIYLNFNMQEHTDRERLKMISWYLTSTDSLSIYDKAVSIAHELPIVSFKEDVPDGFKYVKDTRLKAEQLNIEFEEWKTNFKKVDLGPGWWEEGRVEALLKEIKER